MSDFLTYPDSATPLTNDEFSQLIPKHVSTQSELNAVEQMNIAKALLWLDNRAVTTSSILTAQFLQSLHKRLFGDVWKWAGKFRKTDKNIGVYWLEIPVKLKLLFDNTAFQIENKTFEEFELAVYFHHQLVSIHPFPNGNGRHSRIMTDILLKSLSKPCFSWGGKEIGDYSKQSSIRKKYIHALREADKGDYSLLKAFLIP